MSESQGSIEVRHIYKIFGAGADTAMRLLKQGVSKKDVLAIIANLEKSLNR